jgi:hypothetical protein
MNFFDHKDLGNHLLQLCPKVVKHPVYRVDLGDFINYFNEKFPASMAIRFRGEVNAIIRTSVFQQDLMQTGCYETGL